LKDDIQQLIVAEKAEFAQDPLDTSKQTRLKALLDLQTIIQSQDMPQDQLMIIRDRVAELAVNIRPQPAVSGPAAAGGAYMGAPYTSTPTPPVVSQQPTPVPASAAAVVAAALARPPSAASAPPAPPAGGGVSIDSIFGQGALAALISGARKSATPQQTTPTPQPAPAPTAPAIGPAAAAAIAAAMRSPRPQGSAEPTKPAVAPPPANPSALLAMLRQSGLIKPGGTPTPPAVHALPPQPVAHPQLMPAALKT
jgi:pre-mRNA cleavage complex 2 protein Pcf11